MSARSLLACKSAIKENRISVTSDSFDGVFKLIDKYNLASHEIDELFEWLKEGGTVIEDMNEEPQEIVDDNTILQSLKSYLALHEASKARDVARALSLDKSLVNSILYANKDKFFSVDDNCCWYFTDYEAERKEENQLLLEERNRENLAKKALKFMRDSVALEEPQISMLELYKKHPEFKKYNGILEEYSRKNVGITMKELLIAEGILEEVSSTKEKQQAYTDEIKQVVDDIVLKWKGRDKVKTIPEVFEFFPEYKEYYSKASGYARKIYGITLQQHFINSGLVEPPAALTDEDIIGALDAIKNEYSTLPKESRAADIFQNSRYCYEFSKTINNAKATKLMKMSVGNYFKKEGFIVDRYEVGTLSLLNESEYDLTAINTRLLQYSIDSLIFKNVVYDKLVDVIESIAIETNEMIFNELPIISAFDELECRSYLRFILDSYEVDETILAKKVNDGTILKILFRVEDLINIHKKTR